MLQLKKVRPSLLMIFCLINQQYKDFGVVAKSLALKTPCQKVWRGNSCSLGGLPLQGINLVY
jgi:hypothetical protein